MNAALQKPDLQSVVQEIKSAIQHHFDSAIVAHDLAHLERVYKVADAICIATGGDRIVVAAASYLHDYHRFIERKLARHGRPEEAEPEIRTILGTIQAIPAGLHDVICDAINFTEYYLCAGDDLSAKNPTLEARIVRDADMLDAIGAVGIARAFMFGGFLGEPMWTPTADARNAKLFVHGKTSSIVHHFHEKLLKIESEMLTEQGRLLAAERTIYMRQFVDRLMSEIT